MPALSATLNSSYSAVTNLSFLHAQNKAMDYGFDNIFAEGPTPTPSILGGMEDDMEEVDLNNTNEDDDLLNMEENNIFDVSMSNVDGMNI